MGKDQFRQMPLKLITIFSNLIKSPLDFKGNLEKTKLFYLRETVAGMQHIKMIFSFINQF